MYYLFDQAGWYSGESTEPTPRSTMIAPTLSALTVTAGELRSNFTGYQWVTMPYELVNMSSSVKNREELKADREIAVANIKVTTEAGNTFDGDEISQGRMARAILVLQATATPSTLWVLSDNTPVTVEVAELIEALTLAGAAQSSIWVI